MAEEWDGGEFSCPKNKSLSFRSWNVGLIALGFELLVVFSRNDWWAAQRRRPLKGSQQSGWSLYLTCPRATLTGLGRISANISLMGSCWAAAPRLVPVTELVRGAEPVLLHCSHQPPPPSLGDY